MQVDDVINDVLRHGTIHLQATDGADGGGGILGSARQEASPELTV
jgi:hypothetical protein